MHAQEQNASFIVNVFIFGRAITGKKRILLSPITPCFSQIDETLAETISIIDNNDFIGFISGINEPFESFPGYQNIIYDFDEKFYELIKCHRILSKYNFKQITNIFSPITEEEIKTEKERRVFQISRLHYEEHGCQEAENVANMIISLEPDEERVEKSIGVMLEMIVYYDMKIL